MHWSSVRIVALKMWLGRAFTTISRREDATAAKGGVLTKTAPTGPGRCCGQFDNLTGTVFEGHHHPLEVWILCLYLMELNLSNRQIAQELGLNKDDVQRMTKQLREGVVAKKKHPTSAAS